MTGPAGLVPLPVVRQLVAALRDALGAVDALSSQVAQMRGLFPDDDGAIKEAVEAGEDAGISGAAVLNTWRELEAGPADDLTAAEQLAHAYAYAAAADGRSVQWDQLDAAHRQALIEIGPARAGEIESLYIAELSENAKPVDTARPSVPVQGVQLLAMPAGQLPALVSGGAAQWTVLLLRPDYLASEYGTDTYLAHVEADTSTAAVYLAQEEAARVDSTADGIDVERCTDYVALMVIRGHHQDVAP